MFAGSCVIPVTCCVVIVVVSIDELVRTVVTVWEEFCVACAACCGCWKLFNWEILHIDESLFIGNVDTEGWVPFETTVIGVAWSIWPAWLRNVTGLDPSLATCTN